MSTRLTRSVPTVCHFFFQDETSLNITSNTTSSTFTFTPPANIAGKACLMKLNYCTFPGENDFNSNNQTYSPCLIYLIGIPSNQNITVDPAYYGWGSMLPDEFVRVVGNDNRGNIIGLSSTLNFGGLHNPDIVVSVPQGPTEITLGIAMALRPTSTQETNAVFCISFTPID